MSRLSRGELIAGGSGVALLVVMFLPWYGVDVNLGGTVAFTVADILLSRRIPFVLASGYDSAYIRQRYPKVVAYRKPFDLKVLQGLVARAVAQASCLCSLKKRFTTE